MEEKMQKGVTTAPRPSIGRIVHYFPEAAEPDELPGPYAAMIFGVDAVWNSDVPITDEMHVHLRVTGFEGDESVIHDVALGVGTSPEAGGPSCWRWPDRV